MEPRTESPAAAAGTQLGSLEITLYGDPGGSAYATSTQVRSSADKIAREVPLVVGSLLFAQRHMRSINDPARVMAVDEIVAAATAAREYRLVARAPAPNARIFATYRVDLIANGGFRINVDQKVDGLLFDAAGAIAVGAQANELLATLNEPYRTFYREMLEAATPYWRDRRPSVVESTWVWPVALRRLDFLVRNGVSAIGQQQRCETCQAFRPPDSACLHCGAEPSALGMDRQSALTQTPPAVAPPPPVPPTTAPTNREATVDSSEPARERGGATLAPPAPPVAEPARPPQPPAPADAPPERTIVAAQEIPPGAVVEEPDERQSWPLASLPVRLGAWLVDVIVAVVLGAIGGLGLTSIAVALDWLGPSETPFEFLQTVGIIVVGLYFVLGWTTGETAGMVLFRLGLLRLPDRRPLGLLRAIARAIGYVVALAIGGVVFYVGNYVDNNLLVSIPTGTPADTAIRIAMGLISLYVVWVLTAQAILSGTNRQTLGDRFANAVVAVRKK